MHTSARHKYIGLRKHIIYNYRHQKYKLGQKFLYLKKCGGRNELAQHNPNKKKGVNTIQFVYIIIQIMDRRFLGETKQSCFSSTHETSATSFVYGGSRDSHATNIN